MQKQNSPPLTVKVGGDLACFTRPEMKVEWVSYPVIPPTAARGLLESIFWKPEFTWKIEEIRVLRPIRYFSIMRNEILGRQTVQTARQWQRQGGGFAVADRRNRAQRHTLALRDVASILVAAPVLKAGAAAEPAKYRDQFRRRVAAGRCCAAPYLGCREFSAWFGPRTERKRPLTAPRIWAVCCWPWTTPRPAPARPRPGSLTPYWNGESCVFPLSPGPGPPVQDGEPDLAKGAAGTSSDTG